MVRLRDELAHLKQVVARSAESGLPVVDMLLRDNQRRVEAEQALLDARKWMELAQEAGGIASYHMDIVADRLWWSGSVYRLYGLDPANGEPTVDLWLSTIHPEDVAAVTEVARSAIERGTAINHAFRVILPDGEVRWIHDRGSVDAGPDGRPSRLHGVNIDVTDIRRAQDALCESEEQFRSTFEYANVGVAHVSTEGRFIRLNDYLCQMLGRSQEELARLTFQDLTHPDDLGADLHLLEQLLRGEIESYTMEKRYIRPDGTVIWGDLSVSLLRRPDGSPVNFISVVTDIQGRKAAQDQIELVLGEANHRIKNLLAVIGAVVRNSARTASSVQELEKDLSGKIMGIAASHDLLIGKYETGARLDQLIRRQLEVFTDCDTARIVLDGPDIDLNPKSVHAFGMVLHELATNACKHGALSNDSGIVRINWTVDEASGALSFVWREEGGPIIAESGHQGFGTRTLERMLGGGLGGIAQHTLMREGACFKASLPLDAVQA